MNFSSLDFNFASYLSQKLPFFEDEIGLVNWLASNPPKLVSLFQKALEAESQEDPYLNSILQKMCRKIIDIQDLLDSKTKRVFFETFSLNFVCFSHLLAPADLTKKFNQEMMICEIWKNASIYKYHHKKIEAQSEEEEMIVEPSDISLGELSPLIKQINVKNPKRGDYVDLSKIQDENFAVDEEFIEEGYLNLLHYIDRKAEVFGVPVETAAKEEWYRKLTCLIKHVIKGSNEIFSLPSSNEFDYKKRMIGKELLYLAIAGHHCGERWLGVAKEILETLKSDYEVKIEGLEQQIIYWLQQYQELFIKEMGAFYSEFLEVDHEPHIRNRFAASMIKQGFILKNQNLISIQDDFTNEKDLQSDIIEMKIEQYFHPMMIIKFICDKLNEECLRNPQFPAIALIPFKECAKKQIGAETIEETKKRTCTEADLVENPRPAKKRRVITDEKVDNFISTNHWCTMDEMMTSVQFTSLGVMNVLDHLNFLKKV